MATPNHTEETRIVFASAAAALLALGCIAAADVINIPADYPTIQAGIDAAADGDEIIVAPDTYKETINLAGKALYLHSSAGPATTIIDGAGLDCSVVTCANGEGPGTILAGFTVTGGNAVGQGPRAGCGGGMFVFLAAPTVINCHFADNSAACDGGGVFMDASDNASLAGQIVPLPLFLNCAFIMNSAGQNGGGFCDECCGTLFRNCTFGGNSAGCGGGLCCSVKPPTLSNCILCANTAGEGCQMHGPANVIYSCVEGGCEGIGNIDADPLFVDPVTGDCHLSAGSPCIDAGHNWTLPVDYTDFDADGKTCDMFPVDLDGNPRFSDDPGTTDTGCGMPAVVDMGAYEYAGIDAEIVYADASGDQVVEVLDLLTVLKEWGPCAACCLSDFDVSFTVDVTDLLEVLAAWGPCP